MKHGAFVAMLVAAFMATVAFARANMEKRIEGLVRTGDARPLSGARVTLDTDAGKAIGSITTGPSGAFVFEQVRAGHYRVDVRASDFRDDSVALSVDDESPPVTTIVFSLQRIAAAPIPEIGRVSSRSGSAPDAASTQRLGTQTIEREGGLRLTDALGKLSGVTVSGDAAAPGGDAYVSLRGLRPGESATLLDGHPIGPIGVAPQSPDADGTIAGFNYQDAPYFALRDVAVSFGAANGTTASDVLGGTVDLLTLEPSKRNDLEFEQGFGNQGRASTSIRATGTSGKLGYALVHGIVGTYGSFGGSSIAQTGLRGTDLSSETLKSLTYHVSGDYVLRNELAKFSYEASPATRISIDAYDATSWADKTGEGDNDFKAPGYVLANAPIGASPSCPHGVAVTTDTGLACDAPGAYAAASSGPAGGGPGAWQALRNQDYTARVSTVAGPNTYALDAFTDRYAVLYHRDASVASGALDAFLNRWSTQGVRVSDTLAVDKHTLAFGASWLQQTLDGNGTSPGGTSLSDTPAARRSDANVFVRDSYSPNRSLTFVGSGWLAATNGNPRTHLDPQAAIVYRPSTHDTVRLSAGRATNEAALQSPRVDLVPIGALNPNCGAIANATASAPANVNIGSGPARDLTDERGTDLELAYERRFGGGGNVALTLYDSSVADRIVTGDFSAGSLLPASALSALLARVDQFCGVMPAAGTLNFTLSRAFNVATARLRGIEFAGRARVTPRLALDYGYDVQSIVANDLPASVLATDSTLVNGVQAFGVPLHKASLGFDATIAPGYEMRLDGHAVGPNNPQQLPGYAYADASLSYAVAKHATLLVAASNVFGSHVQRYGLVGEGLAYPTNAFNQSLASPPIQPFNERYGLAPASLTVSATAHL